MVAVNHFYAEQLSACIHTGDANWSRGDDPFLPQIAAASLSATTEYLIVARGMLTGNVDNNTFGLRVSTGDDTDIAAKSEMVVEPIGLLADNGMVFFFVHSFTTSSTPVDIDMELKTFGTARTVSVDQSSLEVVDLTDTGSGNFFETISADPGATTDEYPTTQADEFTIAGSNLGTDEWLVLAYQRTEIGSTTRRYRVEAFAAADTSTSAARATDENEGEDVTELRLTGFVLRHKASSGTPNFSVQTWESAATANMFNRGGYGIAIKTSAFEAVKFEYTAGTTTIDTTERTMETLSAYSPTTTADHVIFGSLNTTATDATKKPQIHVEDDGTEMRVGDQPMEHHVNYDAEATPQVRVFHQDNILSSNTSTYTLRAALVADSDTAAHRWLVLWSLELSAAVAVSRFIRSNLVSRKPLKKDDDRLASTGLISAARST